MKVTGHARRAKSDSVEGKKEAGEEGRGKKRREKGRNEKTEGRRQRGGEGRELIKGAPWRSWQTWTIASA